MKPHIGHIVLVYAVSAAAWILFSDGLVSLLVTTPEALATAGTLKGWAFVGVTSGLLWTLLRRLLRPAAPPSALLPPLRAQLRDGLGARLLPFSLLALAVVAVGAGSAVFTFRERGAQEARRLEAVADLKVGQISAWLEERRADVLALAGDPALEVLRGGDPRARRLALASLEALRSAHRYARVAIVDGEGQVVALSGEPFVPTPVLKQTVRQALREGRALETNFYRDGGAADSRIYLDFVAPLQGAAGGPALAIVLQVAPEAFLFGYMQGWPSPTRSAETLLFRRDGEDLLFITPLRHKPVPPLKERVPLSRTEVLGVIVLRDPARRGVAFEALDYRGVAVMGVGRAVPGTDWFLVAKMDADEVWAGLRGQLGWIGLAAGFALFSTAGAALLLFQRRELLLTRQREELQREQLRSLELLDAIADGSTDAIYAKDRDGRYLFFNREAARLTGVSEGEVLGHDDALLFPPSQAAAVGEADRQAMGADRVMNFEERLDTVDGPRVLLTTRGPLHGPDGQVIGVFGIARDITALRRDEEALREREEIFSAIVNQAVDGIVLLDTETLRFVEFNDAACSRLGYSREAFASLAVPDIQAELSAVQIIAKVQEIKDSRGAVIFESRHRCANGCIYDVELSYRALEIHGRSYLAGIWRDTTDKRKAAEELLKLSLAVEQSSASVIITNLEGAIEYVNRAFLDGAGYAIEEVIGQRVGFLKSGRTPPETYRALWAALTAGRPWEGEFINRRRDGTERVEFARISPIVQFDGRVSHYLGVQEDITERKRVDQELARYRDHLEQLVAERTRQLEETNLILSQRSEEVEAAREASDAANRAKSAFLANMSHEIRTPMNAIIGLTHLLLRSVEGAEAQARLQKVGDAADHLLSIINDILDISKIEAGKLSLDETEFKLEDVIRKACALVADRAHQKGLELVVDTSAVPGVLRGDPTRLGQMLVNYLGNAVKFTDRGVILLRARLEDENSETLQIRFEVTDTGVGIERDALGRLFKPFEQADGSTTRRFGGTGLGLAITSHLARLMGGRAGVESEAGQGSTFWLTARFGKTTHPLLPPAAMPPLRVLVVDDLAAPREALLTMLAALGARPVGCASGLAALSVVSAADREGDPFALLLVDGRMPDMDGCETARRLVALSLAQAPQTILLTLGDDPLQREAALRMGAAAVLPKPVSLSSLNDVIQATLSAHAQPPAGGKGALPDENALLRDHAGQRVLLVEDSKINQEVAVSLLESVGLQVEVADDGAMALEKIGAQAYALILMDMQMPVMDGIEATAAIRRQGLVMPIVAMTANAFGEDRQLCLDAGMNDHLSKPVDPALLYAKLLHWLPPVGPSADADPTLPDLRARLDEVPGLDVAYGLKNLRGRIPNYLRLLHKYVEGHAGDPARVRAELAAGRRPEALRLAHSLKGVAGMIGMPGIQALAARLEAAIRDDEAAALIETLIGEVEAAQAATVAAIRALPNEALAAAAAAAPPAPPEAGVVAAALARIEALLAEDNVAAVRTARETAALLKAGLGSDWLRFDRELAAYDFPSALATLRSRKS